MSLVGGCPVCDMPLSEWQDSLSCPEHGAVTPLYRAREATRESFHQHLELSQGLPTYLPWPLGPGWSITDFAHVRAARSVLASMVCCTGTSMMDGPVDIMVVTEEPGTALGTRCAGRPEPLPEELADGPAQVRMRIGDRVVPLWALSTSEATPEFDRSIVVGEVEGRWLWIVMRPASALLLLRDDWILHESTRDNPGTVEVKFGGETPPW